ncbi:hypothetical protein [Burkholderia gladioli]|uniref:hypothetical protein n=1 Tax=Burkholderia gladioli TaxID=28095 RepID=UPI001917960E|nr:hypothetical protein [Burkholderia gladioli]
MSKRISPDRLLASILKSLVEEFGVQQVREKLSEISSASSEKRVDDRLSKRVVEKRPRLSGMIAMAEALSDESEKTRLIKDLASRFDNKTFLPSMGDVKHFVEMRGGSVRAKQRSDSARSLLLLLSSMSVESLKKIVAAESHSGPSQLGPLADAIKDAGASIRSNSEIEDTAGSRISDDSVHEDVETQKKSQTSSEDLDNASKRD